MPDDPNPDPHPEPETDPDQDRAVAIPSGKKEAKPAIKADKDKKIKRSKHG